MDRNAAERGSGFVDGVGGGEEQWPAHRRKVQRVARQIKEHPGGRPVSLRKKAPPHQVPKAGDLRRHDRKIDIGDLNEILRSIVEKRICIAEPGVTFVDLVARRCRTGSCPSSCRS